MLIKTLSLTPSPGLAPLNVPVLPYPPSAHSSFISPPLSFFFLLPGGEIYIRDISAPPKKQQCICPAAVCASLCKSALTCPASNARNNPPASSGWRSAEDPIKDQKLPIPGLKLQGPSIAVDTRQAVFVSTRRLSWRHTVVVRQPRAHLHPWQFLSLPRCLLTSVQVRPSFSFLFSPPSTLCVEVPQWRGVRGVSRQQNPPFQNKWPAPNFLGSFFFLELGL